MISIYNNVNGLHMIPCNNYDDDFPYIFIQEIL